MGVKPEILESPEYRAGVSEQFSDRGRESLPISIVSPPSMVATEEILVKWIGTVRILYKYRISSAIPTLTAMIFFLRPRCKRHKDQALAP
jgi:hypothetical protein